jgi:hypothetical protein
MFPVLLKAWEKVIELLFNLVTLSTFLGALPLVVFIYYNVFYTYSAEKAVIGCLVLVVLIHVNKSMKGGRF